MISDENLYFFFMKSPRGAVQTSAVMSGTCTSQKSPHSRSFCKLWSSGASSILRVMATKRCRSSGVEGLRCDCCWLAATVHIPSMTMAKARVAFILPPNYRLHRLQNLFSERRKRQFHGQIGSSVMFVNHWVDLDNLKAGHAAVVGDDLHCQVGFAITGAAPDRCSHARSVFRIDPVHIERDVVAGSVASGNAQRFFNHRTHAAFVNVAHGVNLNAGSLDVFLFAHVHVAHAYEYAVFRMHFG